MNILRYGIENMNKCYQKGMVLVVVLLFLFVLSLLVMSLLERNTLQLKMSVNYKQSVAKEFLHGA